MSDSVNNSDKSTKKAIGGRVSEISLDLIADPIDELALIDNVDKDTLEPQKTEDR